MTVANVDVIQVLAAGEVVTRNNEWWVLSGDDGNSYFVPRARRLSRNLVGEVLKLSWTQGRSSRFVDTLYVVASLAEDYKAGNRRASDTYSQQQLRRLCVPPQVQLGTLRYAHEYVARSGREMTALVLDGETYYASLRLLPLALPLGGQQVEFTVDPHRHRWITALGASSEPWPRR